MFGPQSADSIEIDAHYYRKETERWAANARLARLVRAPQPGLFARALGRFGSHFAVPLTAAGAKAAPALPQTLAPVTLLRPIAVLAESEDDLLDGRRGTSAA